jgi:hypothetical protein
MLESIGVPRNRVKHGSAGPDMRLQARAHFIHLPFHVGANRCRRVVERAGEGGRPFYVEGETVCSVSIGTHDIYRLPCSYSSIDSQRWFPLKANDKKMDDRKILLP